MGRGSPRIAFSGLVLLNIVLLSEMAYYDGTGNLGETHAARRALLCKSKCKSDFPGFFLSLCLAACVGEIK